MVKRILFALLLLNISGCLLNFDEQYLYDLRFPATLQINNLTQQPLTLNSIYSSIDTKARFVFTKKYKLIDPPSMQARITEDAYEAFASGHFWLQGICGNIDNWKFKGTEGLQKSLLAITPVDTEKEWKVIITINRCE